MHFMCDSFELLNDSYLSKYSEISSATKMAYTLFSLFHFHITTIYVSEILTLKSKKVIRVEFFFRS
jgi:hypothetical protein